MPAADLHVLHPDRPLWIAGVRHAELRVEAGTVWITVDGAAGDIFLAAGGSFQLMPRDAILAEAVRGPARVRLVLSPAPAVRLAAPLRAWLGRPQRPATG